VLRWSDRVRVKTGTPDSDNAGRRGLHVELGILEE